MISRKDIKMMELDAMPFELYKQGGRCYTNVVEVSVLQRELNELKEKSFFVDGSDIPSYLRNVNLVKWSDIEKRFGVIMGGGLSE